MDEITVRKAKFDKRGRLVCPICGFVAEIPEDKWLTIGTALCGNRHKMFVTMDVVAAVNDILARTRGGNWRKDVLKNLEPPPEWTLPPEEDGNVIFPKPPSEDILS